MSERETASLKNALESRLGLEAVVEGSTIASAKAELNFGIGVKTRSFFSMLFCDQITGSLIAGGRVICRRSDQADGCWRRLIQSDLVARSEDPYKGRSTSALSLDDKFEKLGLTETEVEHDEFSPVVQKVVVDWVTDVVRLLSPHLLTVMLGIGPEKIVIGGLTGRFATILCDALNLSMAADLPADSGTCAVVPATFLADAPAVGAAAVAFEREYLLQDD